jgi:hypothetical protein
MLKVAFPVKAKETAVEASPPARLFKFLRPEVVPILILPPTYLK